MSLTRIQALDLARRGIRVKCIAPGRDADAFSRPVQHPERLEAVRQTIPLRRIGELALEAQATLLRVLQSGEVRAVGATRTSRVDVRLVAATHRDLLAAAREGHFREDLYYRLRRVVLRVPPLRERLEDLRLLVEHIRSRVNDLHACACRITQGPWALARTPGSRVDLTGPTPGAWRSSGVHGARGRDGA